MQDNQEAILAFPVQHSVFISPDQSEIEQIDEIELTPHIQIKETADEVIVSGYLKLEGKYAGKPPKFPDIMLDSKETKMTGYVDSVVFNPFAMDPDDFETDSELTIFREKIPIHIRIARNKIEDVEQVYASVVTFDYEIQSARKLAITAELALNGVKSEISAPPKEEPVSETPLSLEYVALRNAEEEDTEEEAVDTAEEEGVLEPEVEPIAWKEGADIKSTEPEPAAEQQPEPAAEQQPEPEPESVMLKEIEIQESIEEKGAQQTKSKSEVEQPAHPTVASEGRKETIKTEPTAPKIEKKAAPIIQEVKAEEKETTIQAEEKKEEIGEEESQDTIDEAPTGEEISGEEREEEQEEVEEEKQDEARVSITLKGTKRDPVTVTTSLLSSYAEREERQAAEPAPTEADEIRNQEGAGTEEGEEKPVAERKEGALYLTSFMKQGEEGFTRMKMCIAQKDETLDGIAEKYSVSPADIALANGLHTNATVAKGQVLYIPVKS